MITYILVTLTLVLIALAFVPNPKPAWVIWTGDITCGAVVIVVSVWALSSA